MSDAFNTNFINPTVATSTMTGAKCSEIFTLHGSFRSAPIKIDALVGATHAADGKYHRINSDGWSKMLVWQVMAAVDGNDAGTYVILGKRPFLNGSFDTSAMVTGSVFTGFTEDNIYLPCPVISSTVVNPGTDSDDDTANTPPQGSHQCSSTFTFNNHAGTLADVSVTLTDISSTTAQTYVGGGITIDVRGCKEVTLMAADQGTPHGYFLGQFVE